MRKQNERMNINNILDDYEKTLLMKQNTSVASLPNKFVFLAPTGKETEIISIIKQKVETEWLNLCSMVESFIVKYTDNDSTFGGVIKRQSPFD